MIGVTYLLEPFLVFSSRVITCNLVILYCQYLMNRIFLDLLIQLDVLFCYRRLYRSTSHENLLKGWCPGTGAR